ncbi:MAG: 8-oxoguanine DNA glycosylase [Clostridiales bacterium]|nr:8-oxoguanine DNA glycosylase [Clostridiales bacterium]
MRCFLDNRKRIIITDIGKVNLGHIFENGQCFRWNKAETGNYIGVVNEKVLALSETENEIIIENISMDDFEKCFIKYFDFNTDYSAIIKSIENLDEYINEATQFGYGLRMLNQEPFETLISFIVSANNNIPRIKNTIEKISIQYGKFIMDYKGKSYYGFPTPYELSKASIEELRELGLGYRDRYLIDTTKKVIEEGIDLQEFKKMSTKEAKRKLIEFKGVGNKVSECVLLFSLEKYDVFPIDTWVKKILENFYKDEVEKHNSPETFFKNYFELNAGYAQQYLFYYARENNIGG